MAIKQNLLIYDTFATNKNQTQWNIKISNIFSPLLKSQQLKDIKAIVCNQIHVVLTEIQRYGKCWKLPNLYGGEFTRLSWF